MKSLKRCTSLLLVLAMVLSMVITCASAEDSTTYTVDVATEDELRDALKSTDYSSCDQLIVRLTADIALTSTYISTSDISHLNVVINGTDEKGVCHTLTGSGSSAMFYMAANISSKSLTFQNIKIDAKEQQLFNSNSTKYATNCWLNLDNITLTNTKGTTNGGIYFNVATSANASGVTIKNSTISGTGCLVYASCGTISVSDSTLTSVSTSDKTSVIRVNASSVNVNSAVTIEGSTINMTDTESYSIYGVYAGGSTYTTLTLSNSSIIGTGNNSDSLAISTSSSSFTYPSSNVTLSNGDLPVKIALTSSNAVLTTDGTIPSMELVLTNGAKIQLSGTLQNQLTFSFRDSISLTDPVVACGTNDYSLTDSDLENLVYDGTTNRTLTLVDNTAVFKRVSAADGVHVTTEDELLNAMTSGEYDTDDITIYLDNDIALTAAQTLSNTIPYSSVTIDGQGYTLSAPSGKDVSANSLTMFTITTTHSLTFQNMTIDGNSQRFIYFKGKGYFTLDTVTLKNLSGGDSYTTADVALYGGSSSYKIISATIRNTTTENCSGTLLYGGFLSSLTIKDSTLASTDGIAVYMTATSTSYKGEASISGSTIAGGTTGIYLSFWSAELENSTVSGPDYAINCSSYSLGLTLNGCTVLQNDNGTAGTINYASKNYNLITDGAVTGSPEIVLASGAKIQLTGALQNTLYYSFASISGDPTVVVGTTGDDGYTLTDSDLEMLVYSDTDSIRTLKMDTTTETDEGGNTTTVDANSASLYRLDLADCGAELLDGAVYDSGDAVTATLYAYTAEDGSTVYAADTTSVTTSADEDGNTVYTLGETTLANNTYEVITVPVYYATYHDGTVEPDVQITCDETVVDSANYTVAYSGDNTVSEDAEADTVQIALATVTPANDLTGDAVVLPYAVVVASYTDLGAEGAPVTVSISYDSSNGDQYTITVKYNNDELVEGRDYQVASYEIDTVNWVANITIEGLGDYGGTYTLSVSIPGKNTMVQTVYSEETLNAALEAGAATIYLSDSFTVADSVVIDYDVTIDGQGEYAIYVEDADADLIVTSSSKEGVAILSVQGGNVTLTGLTVNGGDQARCLYVADGASVELTGGSVLTGGGISGTYGGQYGLVIYIAEGGAVTLDECQVRDSMDYTVTSTNTDKDTGETTTTTIGYGTYMPIYNLGTLTVQDGAYLTNLPSLQSALYNGGTLNWTGGTFDVDLQGYYTNQASAANNVGAAISNGGTFNMSGGTINGFLLARDDNNDPVLDDAGSYTYTTDRSTVHSGAVYNAEGAEFILSGDATITGFNTTGSVNGGAGGSTSGSAYPYGGGVANYGTFNMTGGAITGNMCGGSTGGNMTSSDQGYGGGVYNAGTFNLSGGEISYNSAGYGGGVYNASTNYHSDSAETAWDAPGTFTMTGGTIEYNTASYKAKESSSQTTGMGTENFYGFGGFGAGVYVAGDSTATISGGTIANNTGCQTVTDDDGNVTTTAIDGGIAVSPSASNSRAMGQQSSNNYTSGTLTITGSPTIEETVALLSVGTSTQTASILNLDDEESGFVASDITTYVYTITSEATETYATAYLLLDGGLETQLNVTTVYSSTDTINFSLTSTAGTDYITSISETTYTVNADGSIVAAYASDRIVVSEDDADLLTVSGASLYLTTTEDGDDAWTLCTHSADLTHVEAADATCTEDGNTEYWCCETCGTLFADEDGTKETTLEAVTVAATGHKDIEYMAASNPTCTEAGNIAYYYCASCGQRFSNILGTVELTEADVTIAATGHSWNLEDAVTENVKNATCTEKGSYDTVIYCANCNEELARATTTVPATGEHTWNDGEVTAEPT
ncbi:MAG: right-handed parallel beta-helix repeat-containing protein, partial [Oscillospiraceae bacterium]|nr:right-handed parallel beta-helix repeat-containing protein [Oscillospiraceae bacterium]